MPARFLIRSIRANEFIYLLVVLIETALLWRLAAELALLDQLREHGRFGHKVSWYVLRASHSLAPASSNVLKRVKTTRSASSNGPIG